MLYFTLNIKKKSVNSNIESIDLMDIRVDSNRKYDSFDSHTVLPIL